MARSRTHPVENSETALPTLPWGVGISLVTQTSANSPDSGQGIQSDCVTFGGSAPPGLAGLHQLSRSHNGAPQGPTAVYSKGLVRSRGVQSTVGPVGGGVRRPRRCVASRLVSRMATFRPFIGRCARVCVSLTCTYVSEYDGSQSGLSLKVAFSDTTLRDPPESGYGEPASDGTSSATVAPQEPAGSAENASWRRVGVRSGTCGHPPCHPAAPPPLRRRRRCGVR